MEGFDKSEVLNHVPVLHVRGTNYQIGLSMGRTFKGMIQDLYQSWKFFNKAVLPNYDTLEGKQIYDDALRLCDIKFPKYVDELRGLAEGAGIQFYKIFMMHIDALASEDDEPTKKVYVDTGCSSILCNNDEMILAQNEDAFSENVNRFIVLSAEVLDDEGKKVEKFTALTYAGLLSGCAMGFNEHGAIFSINTLAAKNRFIGGTPRFFLTRALLSAANHKEVLDILLDEGTGINEGMNVNICYINKRKPLGDVKMYSIEVAPPKISEPGKSQVSVRAIIRGESYVHCNRYLHLEQVEEIEEYLTSTIHRHNAIEKLPTPCNMQLVKNVMSDQSDAEYPVFRRSQRGDKDSAKTVATGIFDIGNLQWYIYVNPPSKSEATVVIDLELL